ncbi:hypothetical protein QBC35DRAFT_508303 [Podospora australis]|uniref:Uncharacterized protein n=1 Tax=Podospora australis TaxID=1536484 RepID=A0AAN7AEV6_9PEZI|nr:hypothetical protein QBC35DRAFT_508303 [Podospora australis]
MFWEYLLSKHCRSSRPCDCQLQRTQWLHHPAITGKTLYNLVVLTIEARMFDQEYRQAPAWFMATRQKRPLVKAVNSFISKMESMYGGYSEVMDAYFGCIIKGAVHLDIPPEDELDGLWEMLAQLRIGGEELDNLLTLMAKLHIDDDEDMLDVEFLDLDEYYWWKEEGIY